MLTKLTIRNFKRLDEAVIPLEKTVVFIGPNNSGKTTALQAIALWEAGLQAWLDKRGVASKATKRSGVTLNRKELIAISVPNAKLLWKDLHVRRGDGKKKTSNIYIEIELSGISNERKWNIGFRFDFANSESFYCRPLNDISEQPDIFSQIKVAFLPPMSGLASVEPAITQGRINVLIGEGQTAQVLRNICFDIFSNQKDSWEEIKLKIKELFGVGLNDPKNVVSRGEISLSYKDKGSDAEFDLSSSGRGLQQTLLLLAYLYSNPGTTILLDEPDAHLEILRQGQIYQLINEVARNQGSQIIAASHSEVVLKFAMERQDEVIAFLGMPHSISQPQQILKSLNTIGFQDYYLAEQNGWILYLEGETDLMMLKAFAKKLKHKEAVVFLDNPFVKALGHNQPTGARDHFYGLREAKKDLVGIAIFDHIDVELANQNMLKETMWRKREFENYFCQKDVLLRWVEKSFEEYLFSADRKVKLKEAIEVMENSLENLSRPSPWSDDIKASDEFLVPLFKRFFNEINEYNVMGKADLYHLVEFMNPREVDQEIREKLDLIVEVAKQARPAK